MIDGSHTWTPGDGTEAGGSVECRSDSPISIVDPSNMKMFLTKGPTPIHFRRIAFQTCHFASELETNIVSLWAIVVFTLRRFVNLDIINKRALKNVHNLGLILLVKLTNVFYNTALKTSENQNTCSLHHLGPQSSFSTCT